MANQAAQIMKSNVSIVGLTQGVANITKAFGHLKVVFQHSKLNYNFLKAILNISLEYLLQMESSNLKDFKLASRGVIIRRDQFAAQKRKDVLIRSFVEALENGRLPIYQYLERCSRLFIIKSLLFSI